VATRPDVLDFYISVNSAAQMYQSVAVATLNMRWEGSMPESITMARARLNEKKDSEATGWEPI
jgi:hypothetical protein